MGRDFLFFVKDIAIFAAEISIFSPRSCIGLPSRFCVCNIVTNYVNWRREYLQLDREKTGKLREYENKI